MLGMGRRSDMAGVGGSGAARARYGQAPRSCHGRARSRDMAQDRGEPPGGGHGTAAPEPLPLNHFAQPSTSAICSSKYAATCPQIVTLSDSNLGSVPGPTARASRRPSPPPLVDSPSSATVWTSRVARQAASRKNILSLHILYRHSAQWHPTRTAPSGTPLTVMATAMVTATKWSRTRWSGPTARNQCESRSSPRRILCWTA
mmetsp:Transcript_72378/g.205891  ORF Transcript_72378/g.205891 Transcript_72378/m.205891 type:complete len:202 (-) Transcript_72378:1799-2404(-)